MNRRAFIALLAVAPLAGACALRRTHLPKGNMTITGNVFRRRWSTLRFGKVPSSGMAVAGLPVRLYYDGKVVDKVFTGYQGYFEFKNLPEGDYMVVPLQGDAQLVKLKKMFKEHLGIYVGLFQR